MRVDVQFETLAQSAASSPDGARVRPVTISVEALAYVALLVFALVLRFAELDSTPIMPSETNNALAAWRTIMVNAPGIPLISNSSLVFTLQSLSFGLFGGNEWAARVATAVGGAALVLTPILLRPLLGRARAFLVSLLFALSPVLLIASRSSSGDVWSLLLAVLSLWAFWRAGHSDSPRYPVFAVVCFIALIFLSGTGGLPLALILLVAGGLTALWRRRTLATEDETLAEPDALDGSLAALRRSLGFALPLSALVVLALAAGFMFYPAGLSSVGEALGGAVQAVVQPQGMSGYATLVSLFYEPFLWLLALVALVVRRDRLTAVDIFLLAWVVLGVVVTLFFADRSPDHALWLTVPLALLASHTLVWIFTPDDGLAVIAPPRWANGVIALAMVGVIMVFTIGIQSVARSMIQSAEPTLTMIQPQPQSVILALVALAFVVIGFFLFASLWGNRTSWQGAVLGLAAFGLITGLGSGWGAAVTGAQNPVEFWHMNATDDNVSLLRETLVELSARETGGWFNIPVTVYAQQDGQIAWLLRDFPNTRYVSDLNDARGDEIIILPENFDTPDLGGAYLGQRFTISRDWDINTLNLVDFPAWWTQHTARMPWTGAYGIVLWLREDIYQGADIEQPVG